MSVQRTTPPKDHHHSSFSLFFVFVPDIRTEQEEWMLKLSQSKDYHSERPQQFCKTRTRTSARAHTHTHTRTHTCTHTHIHTHTDISVMFFYWYFFSKVLLQKSVKHKKYLLTLNKINPLYVLNIQALECQKTNWNKYFRLDTVILNYSMDGWPPVWTPQGGKNKPYDHFTLSSRR